MACSGEGELSDERETQLTRDGHGVGLSVDDEGCATVRGGEGAEEENKTRRGQVLTKVEAALSMVYIYPI